MTRKVSSRVQCILSLLDPSLNVFDLCSDLGLIGVQALIESKAKKVTFVEIRLHLIEQTKKIVADHSLTPQAEFIHGDALNFDLPEEPTCFIIAGVGTNLVISFLKRTMKRSGDLILCHTHQNPTRFEKKFTELGLVPVQVLDFEDRGRAEKIWVFHTFTTTKKQF